LPPPPVVLLYRAMLREHLSPGVRSLLRARLCPGLQHQLLPDLHRAVVRSLLRPALREQLQCLRADRLRVRSRDPHDRLLRCLPRGHDDSRRDGGGFHGEAAVGQARVGEEVGVFLARTGAEQDIRARLLPDEPLAEQADSFQQVSADYDAGCGSAQAVTGTQLQKRFRSPWTASIRDTVGQYFHERVQGAGYAAFSRE